MYDLINGYQIKSFRYNNSNNILNGNLNSFKNGDNLKDFNIINLKENFNIIDIFDNVKSPTIHVIRNFEITETTNKTNVDFSFTNYDYFGNEIVINNEQELDYYRKLNNCIYSLYNKAPNGKIKKYFILICRTYNDKKVMNEFIQKMDEDMLENYKQYILPAESYLAELNKIIKIIE